MAFKPFICYDLTIRFYHQGESRVNILTVFIYQNHQVASVCSDYGGVIPDASALQTKVP